MASLKIEQLDDGVLRRLSALAERNHVSPEEQAKRLLASSVAIDSSEARAQAAARIASHDSQPTADRQRRLPARG